MSGRTRAISMCTLLACVALPGVARAQQTSITFELNGLEEERTAANPFGRFFGEWTLRDDAWTQNWGGVTETLVIPGHHTVSTPLNTRHTLLSIIDGPEPNGHIVWTHNPRTGVVTHLSSFGDARVGRGEGTVDPEGNVQLRIAFEGEAPGTYRIYTYEWISHDAYHMRSVQYGADDEPTGLLYEGTFERVAR